MGGADKLSGMYLKLLLGRLIRKLRICAIKSALVLTIFGLVEVLLNVICELLVNLGKSQASTNSIRRLFYIQRSDRI